MSKDFRILTITTIVLNQLIVILAGHGYGFLIFIEFSFITYSSDNNSISYFDSYDHSLPIVGLLSLIGQMILLISLFINKYQSTIKWLGLFVLLIGYFILSKFLKDDVKSFVSFCWGIPFLLSSIWLMGKLIITAAEY